MADDERSVSVGSGHRVWLIAVVFSAAIVLFVALRMTDFFGLLTLVILAGGFGAVGEEVRVVATTEVMLGILLFLFGFAKIMRHFREADHKRGVAS